MMYMIEFRVKPGHKESALERFERNGPNRLPGVSLRSAWVGTRSDVVFALVESDDESLVTAAAQSWNGHADATVHAVVDIEQF
jgi:hypothetical protein